MRPTWSRRACSCRRPDVVGAAGLSAKTARLDLCAYSGQAVDDPGMEDADDGGSPADLGEQAVRALDMPAGSDLVFSAHLDQRLARGWHCAGLRSRDPFAHCPPRFSVCPGALDGGFLEAPP